MMSPPGNDVEVVQATQASDALVVAFARLLPQLSRTAAPLSREALDEIIHSPCNHLFIATMGGDKRIVGTLTLVHFRIPTGMRAWIEDVVVDEQARGLKVGMALTRAAIAKSRELKAKTLDLTSNPGRLSAHHLYESAGFVMRDTRVYRHQG
ncbi:GNAT family N-acetyltransferase [Achromobacter insolitus]|uniref:GNAT family N-acetyltransferase n=2 Tax=Achromobacter insolitus TaxID=217204 RepID=UPI001FB71348|nr:GNAT family N-acetyltransferase [Achromobacter insolitus]